MDKRTVNAVTREGLRVRVVMAADASWEKVGGCGWGSRRYCLAARLTRSDQGTMRNGYDA
jgi:hypothetical protein